MATRHRWLLGLSAIVAIAAAMAGACVWGWRELNAPLAIPADGARIEVASGMSLRRVADELAARGWLSTPRILATYARYTGDATRIQAGEYELVPQMTALSLLAKLVAGDVRLYQLTVVEGWRFSDLLSALRSHPAIVASSLDPPAIMAALGAPGVHPEGQFFPDTYRFARGTADLDVLRQAHLALRERLTAAWQNRSANTVLKSDYEALILASIIEKETALASERGLISGVFHERLQRNMRLQTDPTVIYGLGSGFNGNLRRQDLERDTPYNTYTRGGLPPTPIALPSAPAILAAVAPEKTGAIYFVATGLGDGSHRFSATLEEHQNAVRDYLRELRRSR